MLLSVSEILSTIPVARSTLYRLMKEPDFPKPVRVGSRVFWKDKEIRSYIDSKQERA
jgi:predicted DNA-binding transcriptional regulator AlpA